MKTTRKSSKEIRKFQSKVIKVFPDIFDVCSLASTYLGILKLLGDYIIRNNDPINLDVITRYAMIQAWHQLNLMQKILRDEISKEEVEINHMPTGGDSWQSDEDFESRLILIVKKLYEQYKEQGKIKVE